MLSTRSILDLSYSPPSTRQTLPVNPSISFSYFGKLTGNWSPWNCRNNGYIFQSRCLHSVTASNLPPSDDLHIRQPGSDYQAIFLLFFTIYLGENGKNLINYHILRILAWPWNSSFFEFCAFLYYSISSPCFSKTLSYSSAIFTSLFSSLTLFSIALS